MPAGCVRGHFLNQLRHDIRVILTDGFGTSGRESLLEGVRSGRYRGVTALFGEDMTCGGAVWPVAGLGFFDSRYLRIKLLLLLGMLFEHRST